MTGPREEVEGSGTGPRRDRLGGVLAALAALSVAAALVVTAAILVPSPWSVEPRPPYAVGLHADGTDGVVSLAAPRPRAITPLTVSIPSIGLRSDLIGLDIEPESGALVPPEDFDLAGWYTGAPVPGEIGPAVITGHVDSWRGPAVFYALQDVTVGAMVDVTRSDGSQVRFRVSRVASYPKSAFPTAEVYGATSQQELRLITCGGTFDRSLRSYRDNIVVYAVRA